MHPICEQKCAPKIFPNNTIVCPISFGQKFGLVLDIFGIKGSIITLLY